MPLPTAVFDPTKTIVPLKSFVRFIPSTTIAYTGANATDQLTVASGHGLANGQAVLVAVTSGMAGVTTGTIYYIVNSQPTTVQIAATVGGAAVNFTSDGAGTLRLVTDIPLKTCKYEQEIETTEREVPDADGLLAPDRVVMKKRKRTYKVDIEDVKTVATVFGSTTGDISGGSTSGNCMLWITDPSDAPTKCAIKVSNVGGTEFLAQWQVDGGQDWNTGDVAKQSITITAREKTIHTVDAMA